MAKIEMTRYIDKSALRAVENKLIMKEDSHQIMMITDLEFITEEETYGRKMNKTRQIEYVKCTIHGYNADGDFIGEYNGFSAERILEHHDILHMAKNFREFQRRYQAMIALHTRYNQKPEETCNCDKRDMPTYEEDGKRCCPQCGLEVK